MILEEEIATHFKILLGYFLEELRKTTKTSKNAGIYAEPPTKCLLNKVSRINFWVNLHVFVPVKGYLCYRICHLFPPLLFFRWIQGAETFLALVGGEWSASRPCRFTPGKEPRYPFYRRLGGAQSRSKRYGEVKIFDPTGTLTPVPLVVQPVVSRYTDWAIPAPT
jgi:hypothetical protein